MAESLMAPPPEVDPTVLDAGYGEKFEGFTDAAGSAEILPTRETAGDGLSAPVAPAYHAQREAVESQLAKAHQVARESGMLRPPSPPQPPQPPQLQHVQSVTPPEERQGRVLPPDSPFQVSTHQDMTEKVPMAQQVSPPADMEPAAVPPPAAADIARGASAEMESSGSRGPFLDRLHRFSGTLRQDFAARAMFLIDNDGQVLLDEVENPKLIQVARTLANASCTANRQSAGSAAVGNLHVKIGTNATLEVVPVRSRYGLLVLGVIFAAPLGAARVSQLTALLEQAVDPEA